MAAYQTGSTGVWMPQQTSNFSKVRDVRMLLLPSGANACALLCAMPWNGCSPAKTSHVVRRALSDTMPGGRHAAQARCAGR